MGVKMKVCPWCGNEMEEYVCKCSKCGEDMNAQGDEMGSMYGASDMAYNGYGGSGNGMYDNSNGYAGNSGGYGDYQAPYPAYVMPDRSRPPARRKGGGGLVLGAAVLLIMLIVLPLLKSNAKKEYGPIVQKIMNVWWNEGMDGVYSKYGFIDYTKFSGYPGNTDTETDPAFTIKTEVKSVKKLFGSKKKESIKRAKAVASSVGAGSYFDEESISEVVQVDIQMEIFLFNKLSSSEKAQIYLVKVKGDSSWKVLEGYWNGKGRIM